MQVERIISHYNTTVEDKRSCLSDSSVNDRLLVALNGCGTSNYDPRPAVAEFLLRRERRFREPDVEVYQSREFAKKFFRKEGHF
jgi:hypothetical protein